MIVRLTFVSTCALLGYTVLACSGSETGAARSVNAHVTDASDDAASSAGGAGGAGGSGNAAGAAGKGGAKAGDASAGGGTNTGGGGATDAALDAACVDCFTLYDLHWGMDGGLTAFAEVSRIGPCRSYSHERTPTRTDPPSLTCNTTLPGCPARTMDAIIRAFSDAAVQAALLNHKLYGNDPRPVDGQVFRISVGNDFIDVGPSCASGCVGMPTALATLVDLLHRLDNSELATEPCKTVFGG